MKNQKGFTIVEFVSVTGILVAVVFLLIPFVTEQIKETRRQAFEDEVTEKIKTLADKCIVGENQNFVITEKDDWGSIEKGGYNINYECDVAVAFYDGIWCSVKDYQSDSLITKQLDDGDRCKLEPLPELICQPECQYLGTKLDLILEVLFENNLDTPTMPSIFHDEPAYLRLAEHPLIDRSEGMEHQGAMLLTLEIDGKSVRLQQDKFQGFPFELAGTVAMGTPYLLIVFHEQDFVDDPDVDQKREIAWVFSHVGDKMMCFQMELINE